MYIYIYIYLHIYIIIYIYTQRFLPSALSIALNIKPALTTHTHIYPTEA